ncbi:MAG TPA: T9SS type A sorting domain-containing protein, partial [Cryomorphaceae bacterium]|nr:T9SS type A sorting domain-containing protein [Cryomorphaceae bacterium]
SGMLETGAVYPSYSVSKGDFDNDGFADLVVQNRAPNPSYVMMNQSSGNDYVKISLEGTVSNKDAIGAWIQAYHDDVQYSKFTLCGQDYYGQSSQHYIFGLGDSEAESVDSISVTYPSGHTDVYYDLPLNDHHYLTEGETYTVNIIAENNGEFCENDSLELSAGNHENYQWSTGDTSQTITVNSGGTYSLLVTNPYGITAENSVEVLENPTPSILENTTPILCFGDSTGTISLINQNNFAPDSVWWSNGMQDAEIDSLPAGSYDYYFRDINGCSTVGDISLNQPSELIIVANTIPETNGNDGEIFLGIFGGTPPFMIEVEDEEQQPSTTTNLPGGTYEITVTDGNGCTKTTTVIVESVVSTRKEDGINFNLYPNPAIDFLMVELPNNDNFSIQVFDIAGKKIENTFFLQNGRIDLAGLAKGTYILEIRDSENDASFKRFTKH